MTHAETSGFLAPLADLTVRVADATGAELPFVLAWPSLTQDVQERITGSRAPRTVSHVLHCAGESPEQAEWLAEQVDQRMRPNGRGILPEVEGRACGRVRRTLTRGPRQDETVEPGPWFSTLEYDFRSRPAPTQPD